MVSWDPKGSETAPVPDLLSSVVQSGSFTRPFYVSVIVTLKGTATAISRSPYRVPVHTEKEKHFSSKPNCEIQKEG